jgi:hypothetical protein
MSIESLIQPVVDTNIALVENVLREDGEVKSIYVVGGFSSCHLLSNPLRQLAEQYEAHFILPAQPRVSHPLRQYTVLFQTEMMSSAKCGQRSGDVWIGTSAPVLARMIDAFGRVSVDPRRIQAAA